MFTVTTKIPDDVNNALTNLASEINRSKGYIVQREIQNYLEEKTDILIALSRIEKGESTISLEDIEKKYELED